MYTAEEREHQIKIVLRRSYPGNGLHVSGFIHHLFREETRVARLNATILELQRQVAELSAKLQHGQWNNNIGIESSASETSPPMLPYENSSSSHSIHSPGDPANVFRARQSPGPTSTRSYLEIAGKALDNSNAMLNADDASVVVPSQRPPQSSSPERIRDEQERFRRELWSVLTLQEMQRMINLYEAEVGLHNPFLDLEELNHYVRRTHPLEHGRREPSSEPNSYREDGEIEEILIAIFAIARVLDEQGRAEEGELWIPEILSIARLRIDRQDIRMHDLILLTLIVRTLRFRQLSVRSNQPAEHLSF